MAETLKEKYASYFKIGVAFGTRDLEKKSELIKTQFNSITCANEMKYVSLNKEPNVYTFENADKSVAFAKENGMAIHGHTLVWHNQTPDYIFENATKESLLATLKGHVEKVKEHYGELATFDAVNEAIEDKSDKYLRETKWLAVLGENYLTEVFRVIHEVIPNTKLFYNDYNEFMPEKRAKILRMLKEMKAQDAPIYGMGMQSHVNIYMDSFDDMKRSIEEYAALGLKIRISELDVSLYHDKEAQLTPDKELLHKQAEYYGKLFRIYREYHEHIDAVTFWGVCDDDSWLNFFPVPFRRNYPLLFDDNQQPKEAFEAIMNF